MLGRLSPLIRPSSLRRMQQLTLSARNFKVNPLARMAIIGTGLGTAFIGASSVYADHGTSGRTEFIPRIPRTDLFKVGGYKAVLNEITTIVTYLQDPEAHHNKGLKPIKGVILSGPPGVGKTHLAEAIAGHAGVPIFIINGSELLSTYVGKAEENLRRLFETAKATKRCIICIDEIDSLAGKRFSSPDTGSEHHINTLVNQLLSLLDENHPGIVVIATTNNFQRLDPAVVRAGRFDKHIPLSLPNKEDRINILEIFAKDKSFESSVNFDHLAKLSTGFSGAMLERWVDEAAQTAAAENVSKISNAHFDQAREVVTLGSKGQINPDQEQKKRIAIHEIGHALIGHLFGEDLYKVSVYKIADSHGITQFLPKENILKTKDELLNQICQTLAGRAAEELFSKVQEGSASDLNTASLLVKHLIQDEGMGKTLSGLGSALELEAILQEQMTRAKKILADHHTDFLRLVEALVTENVLYKEDFLKVMAGEKLEKDKSFFSWWNSSNKSNKSEEPYKLPPKKAFFDKSLEKQIAGPVDYSTQLTIEEIAKAIEVAPEKIRKISPEFNGIKIQFKPSFEEHSHMEKISKILKAHDVENYYFQHLGDPELKINENGCEDFIKFVKSRNSPRPGF